MSGMRPIVIPPLQLTAPDPWKNLDNELNNFPPLTQVDLGNDNRMRNEWSDVKKEFGQKAGVYRFQEGLLTLTQTFAKSTKNSTQLIISLT